MSHADDENRERNARAARPAAGRAPRGGASTRSRGAAERRTGVPRQPAPDDAAEALERARRHARAASAEAILALRALLDAASLAATGAPADAHPSLSRLTRSVEAFAATLNGEGPPPAALVGAIAQALDAEISRWEARAHDEPDARAVLRAYLGLREMLWELGVRRAAPGGRTATDGDAAPKRPRAARAPQGSEPPKRDARGARGRLERVPLG